MVDQCNSLWLDCHSDSLQLSFIVCSYSTLNTNLVLWAMTVPAEWSESAKQSMRKAAFEAGITTSLDSDALVLLHEPEAAALYAMQKAEMGLTNGTSFLIIDAGGGTTDITMHNVEYQGSRLVLGEASHREGIMVGGKLLDQVRQIGQ